MSEHEGKWGGSIPKIPDAPDTRHAEASQPAPEPTVQPWMEALSDDLYDYFVMGGGQPGDQSAIDAISRHAPDVPAVRDAAVVTLDTKRLDWLENNEAHLVSHREKLGDGYGIWWNVVKRGKSLSGHPLGRVRDAIDAAIARVKKEAPDAK